jgi:hypothetical protein
MEATLQNATAKFLELGKHCVSKDRNSVKTHLKLNCLSGQ